MKIWRLYSCQQVKMNALSLELLTWIDAVLVVKHIIAIYRKNETILILISLKHYFLHPEKSILNLR